MVIIHTFIYCLNCKMKIEVTDEYREDYVAYTAKAGKIIIRAEVDCPECGYTNELRDNRIQFFEEEY